LNSEVPGNRGRPKYSSAAMHPNDHISITVTRGIEAMKKGNVKDNKEREES
jgi:hypothetical protein